MSDYRKEKVLRIPLECITKSGPAKGIEYVYDIEDIFPELFYGSEAFFSIAPTVRGFVDHILTTDNDCYDEYGRCRELYDSEKEKYLPYFQKLCPDVNMDDVHLVEYCWYDCSEAPDYYNIEDNKDDFYDEV